jgi:hypothetical protein
VKIFAMCAVNSDKGCSDHSTTFAFVITVGTELVCAQLTPSGRARWVAATVRMLIVFTSSAGVL